MSNGSNKKKNKKPPIRSVVAVQDKTRVSGNKIKKRNIRDEMLTAAENEVKRLKKLLNSLEHGTKLGNTKSPNDMTIKEKKDLSHKMEKMRRK